MADFFDVRGVNSYVSPLAGNDGELLYSKNMLSFPFGAKTKRSGYSAFLGTPDVGTINSLFQFPNIGNDPDAMNLYRASGSKVYYSLQGTGAWTPAINGTISNDAHFGQAILDNVMIGGDGVGSTRWTTNGTAFVNGTLAPVGEFFEQYQNRIFVGGTNQTLFYSTTNDATNWNTSGTSDSSSLEIPGAGRLGQIFKTSDRLLATKSQGQIQRWDGFSLVDMSTHYGPSSPYSVAEVEDYRFFLNQYGIFGYGGEKPQLLSNPIQRFIYNQDNRGIDPQLLLTAPGVTHYYDYLVYIGEVQDDFTGRELSRGIAKYDFQKNEFLFWDFAHPVNSWLSYRDANNSQQLIFGDNNGQAYKMDNDVMTDAGETIESEMVFVFHLGVPEWEKKWNWWRGFFNPGCEANIQFAFSDTYTFEHLIWKDVGQATDGVVNYRFPPGSRSNFLFVRIYESSINARYSFYGQQIDGVPQPVT